MHEAPSFSLPFSAKFNFSVEFPLIVSPDIGEVQVYKQFRLLCQFAMHFNYAYEKFFYEK